MIASVAAALLWAQSYRVPARRGWSRLARNAADGWHTLGLETASGDGRVLLGCEVRQLWDGDDSEREEFLKENFPRTGWYAEELSPIAFELWAPRDATPLSRAGFSVVPAGYEADNMVGGARAVVLPWWAITALPVAVAGLAYRRLRHRPVRGFPIDSAERREPG
ncbi:MAG TPA: hypothetical protein VF796_20160 [Humisphaera sp.]